MIDLTLLFQLFDAYCRQEGIPETTLSSRIYGESKKIALLRERGERNLSVERYNDTLKYLSSHWPDEAEWPSSIARPRPEVEA